MTFVFGYSSSGTIIILWLASSVKGQEYSVQKKVYPLEPIGTPTELSSDDKRSFTEEKILFIKLEDSFCW